MGKARKLWNAITGRSLTEAKMRDLVKATYYAAASDSKSMDFSFASDVGINQALFADLNKLRTRCRYELKQNDMAKGMAKVYANSVIGPGPKLSVHSKINPEWAVSAEREFAKWARHCDAMRPHGGSLGMQLHLGVRQLFPTGEYFKMIRSGGKGSVKLRYLLIRPDRVKTPTTKPRDYAKAEIDNGVEVDADGIPVAYWILKQDPDNTPEFSTYHFNDFIRVPASKVHHVFVQEDPIQHRGEPWMAVNLPTWHKLRRYSEAQIAAAIVATKFATVLVNTNPDVVEDAGTILPSTVLEIQDGMMMVPPPGYEPKQMQPEHPSQNASQFRRDLVSSAGAANAMPATIATQDSSQSNFASARFEGVTLEQEGEVTRKLVDDLDLNPTWEEWQREAVAAGVIDPPPADAYAQWLWPLEERHTDPYKAANANRLKLETSIETVGSIQMKNGIDEGQAFERLVEEVERYRRHGLRHPLEAKTTAQEDSADVTQEEKEQEENAANDQGKRSSAA